MIIPQSIPRDADSVKDSTPPTADSGAAQDEEIASSRLAVQSNRGGTRNDEVVTRPRNDGLTSQNEPDIENFRRVLIRIAHEEKRYELKAKRYEETELKYYTVTYNNEKIQKGSPAWQVLDYYVNIIMPLWLRNGKDRIKLEGSKRQDKGVVWVECYSDQARDKRIGEGHVYIDEYKAGEALRLFGMLNMAFLGSQIPPNCPSEENRWLKSRLEMQFKALAEMDPTAERLQFTPDGVIIKLPASVQFYVNNLDEYYRLTLAQLEQAA